MNMQLTPQEQPISPARLEARTLSDFIAKHDKLTYLKGRWLDEREYEDFAEYKKIIKQIFEDAGYSVQSIGASFTFKVSKNNAKLEAKLTTRSVTVRILA
jgi:hypothetical protein